MEGESDKFEEPKTEKTEGSLQQDEKTTYGHKVILAAQSKFFRKLILGHMLSQSTTPIEFWTVPPSKKVFELDPVPSDPVKDTISVYIGQNEYEPCIIAVRPTSQLNLVVKKPIFTNSLITSELYIQDYVTVTKQSDYEGTVGQNPDPLLPIEDSTTISLAANVNNVFWLVLHVPYDGVNGKTDYEAFFEVGTTKIPLKVHVFNLKIPKEQHIKTDFFSSDTTIMTKYGVDRSNSSQYWKYLNLTSKWMLKHRMQLTYALTPAEIRVLHPEIKPIYDCDKKQFPWKPQDELSQYDFQLRAPLLLNEGGIDLDGVSGFSIPMAIYYWNFFNGHVDPRPAELCGITREDSDYLGPFTSPYNKEFGKYLKALEDYLVRMKIVEKVYWYILDEPWNEIEYDAVAWMTSTIKHFAPKLQLFITEHAREELYNNRNFSTGKIDVWCDIVSQFIPKVHFPRKAYCGEEYWVYFGLEYSPNVSPIMIDHQGIDPKMYGYYLWRYRITGILYYAFAKWNQYNPWVDVNPDSKVNGAKAMIYPPGRNNQPITYGSNNHRLVSSIRFELLRDALEDYEYLYLLNGAQQPDVMKQYTLADQIAKQIAVTQYSFLKNDEMVYNVRKAIGLYIGKEISNFDNLDELLPCLSSRCLDSPPKSYYINFQDLTKPPNDPLVVDGNTYIRIQRDHYDPIKGYGWNFGSDVGFEMMSFTEAQYPKLNPLQRTTIKGRRQTFVFNLPNGLYNVTLSIGLANWSSEMNYIRIQGVIFFDFEITPMRTFKVVSKMIYVTNRHLFMDTSNVRAAHVNYLMIETMGESHSKGMNLMKDKNYDEVVFDKNGTDSKCTFGAGSNGNIVGSVIGALVGVFFGLCCIIVIVAGASIGMYFIVKKVKDGQ